MVSTEELEDVILGYPDPVVTVPEIATRVDASDTHVRQQMSALQVAGRVRSKDVGARATAWWHVERVSPAVVAPEEHPDQTDLPEQERRHAAHSAASEDERYPFVDDLDLPGTGDRLAERRGAVRGMLALLEEDEQKASELRETVFSEFDVGYESAESFWNNLAKPALSELQERGEVQLVNRSRGIWRRET